MIDYESVQPSDLSMLEPEHFRAMVFVGATQSRVPVDLARALQKMGPRGDYVQITGNGKNALDFRIAFHIGLLAATEPEAYFHVISKDTGFDPLIEHLKCRKILASRSPDVSEIPILKAGSSTSLSARVAEVIRDLQRRGTARPKTVRTLLNTIAAVFHKQLEPAEIQALFEDLVSRRIVRIDGESVSYELGVRAA